MNKKINEEKKLAVQPSLPILFKINLRCEIKNQQIKLKKCNWFFFFYYETYFN